MLEAIGVMTSSAVDLPVVVASDEAKEITIVRDLEVG